MKKVFFVFMTYFLFAGCTERVEQRNFADEEAGSYKGFPVKVGVQGDKPFPVEAKIEADETLPVKVTTQNGRGLPVELQVQNDKKIPVKLVMGDEDKIPVVIQGQADESQPIKVQVRADKDSPLEVGIKTDRELSVKADIQSNKALPVKILPDLIAWAALFVAVLTVFFVWRSARKAQLAAEGRLFFEQLQDYATKEMRDDVRMLWDWGKEKGGPKLKSDKLEEAAKDWVKDLFNRKDKKRQEEADRIDVARRHITHYFLNIHQLRKSRYVKKRFLKDICRALGTGVLDINFPLEKILRKEIGVKNKESHDKIERELKKLEEKFNYLKKLSLNAQVRN